MNTQLKIINRINKHVALHYTYTKWIKKTNRFRKTGWMGFIFSASNTLIEYLIHKTWMRIRSEWNIFLVLRNNQLKFPHWWHILFNYCQPWHDDTEWRKSCMSDKHVICERSYSVGEVKYWILLFNKMHLFSLPRSLSLSLYIYIYI